MNAFDQLPRKGDRVKLSAEGLAQWPKPELRGTVIGQFTQRRGLVRLKWDGKKEPHSYAGRFIEKADDAAE